MRRIDTTADDLTSRGCVSRRVFATIRQGRRKARRARAERSTAAFFLKSPSREELQPRYFREALSLIDGGGPGSNRTFCNVNQRGNNFQLSQPST